VDTNATGDVSTYERYADAMLDGQVPYRDFFVEYPPGSLAAFLLPELGGDHYLLAFKVAMLALCALTLGIVIWATHSLGTEKTVRVGAVTLVAAAPLLLGTVTLTHYDLWPTALAALGIALVLADRPRLGLATIGLATAAKVFPIVVAPFALVYVARRHGRRAALAALAAGTAAFCVVVLPFVALAPGGVWYSLRFQLVRPLQIETLGAGVLLAAHHLGLGAVDVVSSYNSQNLEGGAADTVAALQLVALAAVLIALLIAFARGPAGGLELVLAAAAALTAAAVLGKVLSPQYLVWPLAAIPLVAGRRVGLVWALTAAALLLTQSLRFWDGVGLTAAGWIVLARGGALVALLALLAAILVSRRPRPA
jgi:uncharacterized membrane protein